MTDDSRPAERTRVDDQTVERLAAYADLPLEPTRRALLVEGLEQFLALSDSWAELALAFRFEDGVFSYAPLVAQYRPEWRYPTALNKFRVVGEDGTLVAPESGERQP